MIVVTLWPIKIHQNRKCGVSPFLGTHPASTSAASNLFGSEGQIAADGRVQIFLAPAGWGTGTVSSQVATLSRANPWVASPSFPRHKAALSYCIIQRTLILPRPAVSGVIHQMGSSNFKAETGPQILRSQKDWSTSKLEETITEQKSSKYDHMYFPPSMVVKYKPSNINPAIKSWYVMVTSPWKKC